MSTKRDIIILAPPGDKGTFRICRPEIGSPSVYREVATTRSRSTARLIRSLLLEHQAAKATTISEGVEPLQSVG